MCTDYRLSCYMFFKILNNITFYTLLERERDLDVHECKCPIYLVLYHLQMLHLHTGNLKEHTCAHNIIIDLMLDISKLLL